MDVDFEGTCKTLDWTRGPRLTLSCPPSSPTADSPRPLPAARLVEPRPRAAAGVMPRTMDVGSRPTGLGYRACLPRMGGPHHAIRFPGRPAPTHPRAEVSRGRSQLRAKVSKGREREVLGSVGDRRAPVRRLQLGGHLQCKKETSPGRYKPGIQPASPSCGKSTSSAMRLNGMVDRIEATEVPRREKLFEKNSLVLGHTRAMSG
jgi:hypothetical protein